MGKNVLTDDEEIKQLMASAKKIAVVGLSKDPSKDSYRVAKYLQDQGYKIIPVNPTISEVLGEKAYPSLKEVPGPVDIVDVFRRPEDVPPIVEAAAGIKAGALWMQLGIVNEDAAKTAAGAGMKVVMDRCLKVEHGRLMG
ncbi:MAG: CoA-binding protein [Firmicutes bacterium]|nr:CoA-binding protein [Bacillota bacterium]